MGLSFSTSQKENAFQLFSHQPREHLYVSVSEYEWRKCFIECAFITSKYWQIQQLFSFETRKCSKRRRSSNEWMWNNNRLAASNEWCCGHFHCDFDLNDSIFQIHYFNFLMTIITLMWMNVRIFTEEMHTISLLTNINPLWFKWHYIDSRNWPREVFIEKMK